MYPDSPTRPRTVWLRFLDIARERPMEAELEWREFLQVAAVEWKAMSEEERAPLYAEYKRDMDEYKAALAEWKAFQSSMEIAKPRRPPTPYFSFNKDVMTEHPDMKVTDVSKIAGRRWRRMTEEEKAPYVDRVAPLWETYAQDLADWHAKVDAGEDAGVADPKGAGDEDSQEVGQGGGAEDDDSETSLGAITNRDATASATSAKAVQHSMETP